MKKFLYIDFKLRFFILLIIILTSVLPLGGILGGKLSFLIISTVIWLSYSIVNIYNCYFKKIMIADKGVTFKSPFNTYHLDWKEIKYIGVADNYVAMRPGAQYIYFTSKNRYLSWVGPKLISNETITLRYRKSAMKEIMKHWDKRIIGAYRT